MLLNHCGTHRAEERIVRSIPAPQWTKTWHPVSHGQVIASLEQSCTALGLGVKKREYSISKDGHRMFGAWDLDLGRQGMGYSLGFRNGTNKDLLLGICSGTRVFVCDNLCFSGSFIRFRKHTGGLDLDELDLIGREAITGAVVEMEKMGAWQEGLHEIWVPKRDRKELIYDMATRGVFSPGQLNNYLGALQEELQLRRGRSLDNAHSLFSMHGAATRLMRSWNLERVVNATSRLNAICDDYLERRAA